MDRQRPRTPIAGALLLIGLGLVLWIQAFYLRER